MQGEAKPNNCCRKQQTFFLRRCENWRLYTAYLSSVLVYSISQTTIRDFYIMEARCNSSVFVQHCISPPLIISQVPFSLFDVLQYGRVRSAEGLSPHREIFPRSDMAALPQQGAAPLAPLRGYPCTPTKTVHPPLASVPFLRVLLSYPGGDTHSHLPLEHRHCEPRKRQISRCRSRLPKRRKADKRMGRNDP